MSSVMIKRKEFYSGGRARLGPQTTSMNNEYIYILVSYQEHIYNI